MFRHIYARHFQDGSPSLFIPSLSVRLCLVSEGQQSRTQLTKGRPQLCMVVALALTGVGQRRTHIWNIDGGWLVIQLHVDVFPETP